MKTLITSLTVTHVLAGIIALLVGIIPMVVQKGNRLHNRAGLVYVWCMIVVAVTAILLCTLQPFRMMRLFLSGIAILSFYFCMSGWRATKQKKGQTTLFDRGLVYTALGCGLAMALFGTYLLVLNGFQFLPIVFTFFGLLLTRFGVQDVQQMRQPTEKMHWFFQHFTRMGASYIATFTAAAVTNQRLLTPADAPEWVATAVWIAPSILGGMMIGRTVAYYKRKFAPTVGADKGLRVAQQPD
ncbi:DUF2306 domain-containing protein [Fibrella sp. WM1]|uniref:DUF2306 domain-containing protein n=1 Tax=Fibrella musci TaxID=3242485 RepID=UPI00352160C1